ncbi:dolichyl-phosphate mannosyltransferase polypeptide 3 [Grosmannia clavigera kw1407]|uniref:Dolichol-phosphate mannosyltransferase subunit 3 n=1 Tax=Grosmannia clavigera (strain kw1407 / UAMH 11150) TaxID=655863 RepID=F0XNP5_GROCL|nr:dolichyl-phosphate mannosyltransferase polypeptide 3 [Grosmannia clavigera kw1407]EFX00248.1 dolichyl-phosphate mannosyltransferase polypeptide 3 [Grosmannia clavigera kw1407]
MTRAVQTISVALLATSVYLSLYLQLIPLPLIVQEEIVPVIPFWFIVSLGAFLLGRLGWGIVSFNDCPDAYQEILSEIDLAKVDLRKAGVTVD